jgi:ribosomal protein S18 acetylase RimI-like enzyme
MLKMPAESASTVRPLTADDVDRVVAIDREHSGHSRRPFFEKRFAAARAHPDDFVDLGVVRGKELCGFTTARILRGEFGGKRTVAVLDGLGIEIESQNQGLGRTLMAELADRLRFLGIRTLQSQAAWTDHNLLRFFAAAGFELAPRLALLCAVRPLDEQSEDV